DSTKDIRKALYSPHPRLCENYNPLTDFVYEHVRTTGPLAGNGTNPLTNTQDLPESWFRINVWRTLDIAFSDMPFMLFVGGEKAGLATRERNNRSRTLSNMQRKAIERKGDGYYYVRPIGSRTIYWAVSEAGP
ncbi:2345_t:CDS:2, partial [Paraglomus occultum]